MRKGREGGSGQPLFNNASKSGPGRGRLQWRPSRTSRPTHSLFGCEESGGSCEIFVLPNLNPPLSLFPLLLPSPPLPAIVTTGSLADKFMVILRSLPPVRSGDSYVSCEFLWPQRRQPRGVTEHTCTLPRCHAARVQVNGFVWGLKHRAK